MCKEYNGYTNYETWNVALWIDNDEGTSQYIRDEAIEIYNDAAATEFSTKKQKAIYDFQSWLKEYHEEANPLANDGGSTYSDLLQAALDSVNWYELAENWIDQIIDDELVEVETELDLQD